MREDRRRRGAGPARERLRLDAALVLTGAASAEDAPDTPDMAEDDARRPVAVAETLAELVLGPAGTDR